VINRKLTSDTYKNESHNEVYQNKECDKLSSFCKVVAEKTETKVTHTQTNKQG
jgi:hypothetical protein